MGFRQGGFMTVWSTELSPKGNTTKVRLSSSRKNRMTGEYEQDFSGFCTFIGNAHSKASQLKPRDRIKLGECDVSTTYHKDTKTEYVNYAVFDFEMANGGSAPQRNNQINVLVEDDIPAAKAPRARKSALAADGDVDEDPFV